MDKSSLEALIHWLEIWSAIFGILVVVGVAGESFFGIRLLWNNWKLQRVQDSEAVDQQARTAEAELATARLKASTARFRGLLEGRQIIAGTKELEPLRRFAGTPLYLEHLEIKSDVTATPEQQSAELGTNEEISWFAGSFMALTSVGWETPASIVQPTMSPWSLGVTIWSKRAIPGATIDESRSLDPYTAVLDSPTKEAWCAAEALKAFLIDELGLGSTIHSAADDKEGRIDPRLAGITLPDNAVFVQIGLPVPIDLKSALQQMDFDEQFPNL